MNSVIIRKDDDFTKINEEVEKVEFYEYDGLYDISNLELKSISYTKMSVDLCDVSSNIKSLGLFDCDFSISDLNRFSGLEELEITNRNIDILDILKFKGLKSINLNFSKVFNVDKLVKFDKLEEVSLVDANISDFNFLFDIKSLSTIVVSDKCYFENEELFLELSRRGVLVLDMMGGAFNAI